MCCVVTSAPPSQFVVSVRGTVVLNVLTPTLVGITLFGKPSGALALLLPCCCIALAMPLQRIVHCPESTPVLARCWRCPNPVAAVPLQCAGRPFWRSICGPRCDQDDTAASKDVFKILKCKDSGSPRKSKKVPLTFGTPGWQVVMPLLSGIKKCLMRTPSNDHQNRVTVQDVEITEYEPALFHELRDLFGYQPSAYLKNLGISPSPRLADSSVMPFPPSIPRAPQAPPPPPATLCKPCQRLRCTALSGSPPHTLSHHAPQPSTLSAACDSLCKIHGIHCTPAALPQ